MSKLAMFLAKRAQDVRNAGRIMGDVAGEQVAYDVPLLIRNLLAERRGRGLSDTLGDMAMSLKRNQVEAFDPALASERWNEYSRWRLAQEKAKR